MSGKIQNKDRDRFDLEQEILECWKVINDIELYIDQDSSLEEFQNLARYYDKKFERLWSTFEQLVSNKKI